MPDKLLTFLNIIAWIFGVIGTVVTIAAIYLNVTYEGSADYWQDRMRGKTRTYQYGFWLVIAIICWVFLIIF